MTPWQRAAALFGLVTYVATAVVVALSQERSLLAVFSRSLAPSLVSNISNLAVTSVVLAVALVSLLRALGKKEHA